MTKNFEKRDGRIVIHRIEKTKDYTSDNKVKAETNSDGLVKLTPTDKYLQSKMAAKYGNRLMLASQQQTVPTENPEATPKKKPKKQQRKKNKKFKNKKKSKKMFVTISENLSERSEKSGNLMAELLKHSDDILVCDNTLWLYEKKTGCFHQCGQNDIASKLRNLLNEKDRLKVTIREYFEAYQQLLISDEIKHEAKFFSNKPYVNCLNGVVDVDNMKLLEHSPKHMFKHCITAKFDPDAKCKRFLAYVKLITGNDDELIKLVQVMLGYILSHYNNSKVAFTLFGIPHTGKSVLCKIIEDILGSTYVSNVDLALLRKQEYAASLSGKILNIVPDLTNEVIKDIGFFKSLVSHDDTISARLLYENPSTVKGEIKMLFSTNHLICLDSKIGQLDAEAFFNRLIYIPFQNGRISETDDNKNFSDDVLQEERDGIFTWAMGGLKQYLENGECFPKSKLSSDLKADNMANYYPEKAFFDKYLKLSEDGNVSTLVVKDLFDDFRRNSSLTGSFNIHRYITENLKIKKTKKRIDLEGNIVNLGNPIAVYEGIKLRKTYRN